jgi:hypothetical protein
MRLIRMYDEVRPLNMFSNSDELCADCYNQECDCRGCKSVAKLCGDGTDCCYSLTLTSCVAYRNIGSIFTTA